MSDGDELILRGRFASFDHDRINSVIVQIDLKVSFLTGFIISAVIYQLYEFDLLRAALLIPHHVDTLLHGSQTEHLRDAAASLLKLRSLTFLALAFVACVDTLRPRRTQYDENLVYFVSINKFRKLIEYMQRVEGANDEMLTPSTLLNAHSLAGVAQKKNEFRFVRDGSHDCGLVTVRSWRRLRCSKGSSDGGDGRLAVSRSGCQMEVPSQTTRCSGINRSTWASRV